MKRIGVLIAFLLGFSAIFALNPGSIHASEGKFHFKNTVNEDSQCFALSVLMDNLNYNLLVTCRELTYPGGTEVFRYVVWANPIEGGNAFRLGELGVGKAEFSTKTAFSSLFVTREREKNARTPSGPVVMQANFQRIIELDGPSTSVDEPELGEPEATMTPLPTTRPTSSITRVLATGGIITFLILFAVIAVVFFITRRG